MTAFASRRRMQQHDRPTGGRGGLLGALPRVFSPLVFISVSLILSLFSGSTNELVEAFAPRLSSSRTRHGQRPSLFGWSVGQSMTVWPEPCSTTTRLQYGSQGGGEEEFDVETLQDRLMELRVNIMEEEYMRPPNPNLSPTEVIAELLKGLWNNSDPLPDSGFRMLLRASTGDWRRKVYDAVAAPENAGEEVVAQAVGEAMGRPHNQFGILVGEGEEYVATFPAEQDYQDGTCWVECRLRAQNDDTLLVVTGWQLEQRKSDKAWLVAQIDWHDFREEFRPGIGQEEWMRICG